jgi:hypothetical protein
MKYALITSDRKITQVADKTFPVHSKLRWVVAPSGVDTTWSYNGISFTPPAPLEQPPIDLWGEAVREVLNQLMRTSPYSQLPSVVKFKLSQRP